MSAVLEQRQALAPIPAAIASLHMSDEELMQVLETSIYRGAKRPSIKMVIAYCRATGLDPLQKPVHIVPVNAKNPVSGTWEWVDTVWPGINLYRTQASRTGQHAGTSEPEYGPMVTQQFAVPQQNGPDRVVTVSFPEWCRVVVTRILPGGERAQFVGYEFWVENYATKGKGSDAPNEMWTKRPRGQIAKCAEAQALRRAFPEFASSPTAEEMEGKTLDADGNVVRPANTSAAQQQQLTHCPADVLDGWIGKARAAKDDAEAVAIYHDGLKAIDKDLQAAGQFKKAVIDRRTHLRQNEQATDAQVKAEGDAAKRAQAAAGEGNQQQQAAGSGQAEDDNPFAITYAKLTGMFKLAVEKKDAAALEIAGDWIPELPADQRADAQKLYDEYHQQLKGTPQ